MSIVSEQQAIQLISAATRGSHNKDDYKSGDILNGNGTMEFHQATKQVSVTFRNLQLKKIKRAERKQATESVMDEKFAVLFWSEFQVADLRFQVRSYRALMLAAIFDPAANHFKSSFISYRQVDEQFFENTHGLNEPL